MAVSESAIRNAFDLKVTFVKTASQKIKIQDLTNWVGLGMSFPSDAVLINFKVVSPSGVVLYQNTNFATPDMDVGASDLVLDNVTFPNAATGDPLEGGYIIYATIQYTPDGESALTYVILETHTYSSTSLPVVAIEHDVDCINGRLTSRDVTNYPSSYTLDSRVHTFYYPRPVPLDPVVTDVASKIISPLYTGTGTTTIASTITVNLSGGTYAQWLIEGDKEILVQCDFSLCDISCCMETVWRRYSDVKSRNTVEANKYLQQMQDIVFLWHLIRTNLDCGENEKAADHLTEILKIAGCNPGCGCTDGTPQLVIPLGGGAASGTVIVTSGEGTIVTPNVVGDITTYVVSLTDEIIAFMESNFVLTLTTDTPDYIQIVSSDPQHLKVNFIGTSPSMMSFRLIIDINSPAAVSATFDLESVYGTRFEFQDTGVKPTFATIFSYGSAGQVANGPAAYKLTNFLKSGAAAKKDKVLAEIQKIEKNSSNDDVLIFQAARIQLEIIKVENNEFWFRIVGGGAVYTHQQLINMDIDKIYVHFVLIEGTP